ncbi:MAG: hypothetical protein ACLGIT_11595 [Gammaproteobacteria bacterium]
MSEAALACELRALRQAVEALRDELRERWPDAMTPEQRDAVRALGDLFGPGCFSTRELVQALRLDIGTRADCRAAIEALAGTSTDAQRVGQALALIVRRGGRAGAWRLTRPAGERGAALWAIERAGAG